MKGMIAKNAFFGSTFANIQTAFTAANIGLYTVKTLPNLPEHIPKTLFVQNSLLVGRALLKYYFGNANLIKPAAVLGTVPLGSVQELSHAMSNRILKYRAAGGVFLADQEGGNQSLRIVGKAYGENRYLFLTILDFLFLFGHAKPKDLLSNTSVEEVEELEVNKGPWKQFERLTLGQGMTDVRFTFPVITRNRIYRDMYIETYDLVESVEEGKNVTKYIIFMRKYTPEPEKRMVKKKTDNGVKYFMRNAEQEGMSYSNLSLISEYISSMTLAAYRQGLILGTQPQHAKSIWTTGVKGAELILDNYENRMSNFTLGQREI